MAIEAAEALVAEGGIEQLSTRKVAARIGYTAGTLYLVFKDINHLVLEVNGRTLDALRATLDAAGKPLKDDRKAVAAICRAYLAFSKAHPALWSLLFERHWGLGFERPDWYQAKKADCFRPLAQRLQGLGIARDVQHLEGLTRILWSSIHGTCVLNEDDKLTQAGAWESERQIDLQVELFLRAAKP